MDAPDPETAVRDSIRSWSSLPQLAEFAVLRHGYGNSDGGFGVTYPEDQDEYDRAVGPIIPAGHVEVYGFWGAPDGYELIVTESFYLGVLGAMLEEAGFGTEAESVRGL
jgi:hypothetical protein